MTSSRFGAPGIAPLRVWLALAAGLAAPTRPALPLQRSDSLRLRRAARDAQADFEFTRRHNLPVAFGHGGGPCDERIGRFCYWYDGDAAARPPIPPPPPPPEPEQIRRARVRLLATLDSAAALLPGDEWIAGQRVRYLAESGRTADAVAAARACRAVAWWCEALTGLALHVAGDAAEADRVYRAALGDMPHDERCRWTDLSLLLEGELARRYRRLGCDERSAFEERLWWLAQPLYSRPGNDRRTEQLARATMARIEQDARSTYGVPWGDDLREVMLRFGWPSYWTRGPATASGFGEPPITGHEPEPAFHFLPGARALDDPGAATAPDWRLEAPRPREHYAPRYATAFAPLAHQVAQFRRGDSCLVVVAYDVGRDTLFADAALDAALVLAPDERAVPVIERRAAAARADQIVATVSCHPQLLSLEVVAAARQRVARVRYGVRPPRRLDDGLAISDVLLFDPPDSLPGDLAAILSYLRPAATARADSRLGLFWELAGLDSAEAVTTAVAVIPTASGLLRRATESLGLAARRAPVRLEWQEVPRRRGAVAGRALTLDLSGLSPGSYRIEVTVVAAGGRRVVATRELEIEGR